jgi:GMP synthase-like glutamine amidotransferase
MRVWMSHGDKLAKLPEGFHTIAITRNSEFAAIGHETKPIYAIQFHPEVTHTIGYVFSVSHEGFATDTPELIIC